MLCATARSETAASNAVAAKLATANDGLALPLAVGTSIEVLPF
jgi:hypothetical protein